MHDDEITLKELILKVKEYWKELWKNWWLILLLVLIFAGYKFIQAYVAVPVYPAILTFMVDEDEGNSMAGMSNILGQIGLGNLRKGKYNLDKVLEISRSRRVLQMAFFSSTEIAGKKDLLANHLIDELELFADWDSDSAQFQEFRFRAIPVDSFDYLSFFALKLLYARMIGTDDYPPIYTTSYDEDTGIMSLVVKTTDEELSLKSIAMIYDKLREYYIEKSTEKTESTYKLMQSKSDSLAQELALAESRLAEFVDRNQNIFSAREGSLRRTRLANKVGQLQTMYSEAIKNLEYADFALKSKTPFITVIDTPIPPLYAMKPSKFQALLFGSLFGGLLSVGFIVLRKIYRDSMI